MEQKTFKNLEETEAKKAAEMLLKGNFSIQDEYKDVILTYSHIDQAILLEEGIYVCFHDSSNNIQVKVGLIDRDTLTDYPYFKGVIYKEGKRSYLHMSHYEECLNYLKSLGYFKQSI